MITRPSYTTKKYNLKKAWDEMTDEEQEYIQRVAWDNELKGIEMVFQYNGQIVEVI